MAGKSTISITFKLDGDGKGFKDLAKDADSLKQVMTVAVVEANKLNKSVMDWSLSVQAIGQVSNAVGQLNSTLQNLTADSMSFGKAMKAANTMAGKDAAGFDKLKGQVAELSKEIPIARDELANGLYMVISNGVPEDNWISYLQASAKASVGGIAELGKAVTVTSTIIKNYGLEWSAAQDIQDKIQLTAKNGVTSFEQLSEALPSVAGSAAQLGITIDELMAIFATCTGVTGNTAEVSTQLGAVLKALIKPSTEAAKAAEEMGIKFDAAAIKEAGGLDNFLKSLDQAINEYSARTGELSETIYGNLFGSARALRLLTSLTGEQSGKFTENIGAMVDSAGTIDKAFEEMSSTGSATTQMLKNQFAAVTDLIAAVVGGAMPYINFTAQLGMATMSIATLTKTIKALNIQHAVLTLRTKAAGASMLLFGLNANRTAAFTRVFSAALKSGAYSATAFKIALKGLLITTGIGAVIVGVTSIIEYFASKTDEATEATNEFSEAEEAFKEKFAETETALNREIKTLADLIKANKDTTEAVNHLNEAYGDIFGTHKTAADWYDTLTKKSKDYCTQLALEAKASTLNAQISKNNADLLINAEKKRQLQAEGKGPKTVTVDDWVDQDGREHKGYTRQEAPKEYRDLDAQDEKLLAENKRLQAELSTTEAAAKKLASTIQGAGTTGTKELKVAEMNLSQVKSALEANEKKGLSTTDPTELAQLKKSNAELQARKKYLENLQGLGTTTKGGSKKTAVANPKTYEELSTNIEIYKKKLTGADTAEQKAIREKIAGWQKQKDAIELAQKAATRPVEIKTLQDVGDELNYLRTLRQQATQEQLAGIDKQIAAMELLQAKMERPSDDVLKALQSFGDKTVKINVEQGKVNLPEIPADDKVIKVNVEQGDVDLPEIPTSDKAIKVNVEPGNIDYLQAISKEIAYQRKLRASANKEALAGIDAEISRLQVLQSYLEHADIIDTPDQQLQTYDQLNTKLSYYTDLLNVATVESRPKIQTHIKDLERIKKSWDDALDAMEKPADVTLLNTIDELDEAIKYYQAQQNRQTADEIANTQRTIQAYEAKKKALQRGIEIPSMQKEISEINALTGREYKMKIKSMGFDELTAKIHDLRAQLADLDHPVTENQRKDIEQIIATYEKWRSQTINAFSTFKSGWESVKGIGSGIESITSALEGNGNAWQQITAFVDGFIQLVEGIQTVISIIDLLTAATTAHTVAKAAEGTATIATTTAQGVEAAAQEAVAAAVIPVIATNKLATASYVELAAAMYMAAHASIPFAGFAIGAGFASAAAAMVMAIGLMPFAEGGVVSGPTMALIGEYTGASNNPEVVAPLDKLRSMIEPGIARVEVVGKIAGRDIVLVQEKELKHRKRS